MSAPAAPLLQRVPLGAAVEDPGAILDRFLDWVKGTEGQQATAPRRRRPPAESPAETEETEEREEVTV